MARRIRWLIVTTLGALLAVSGLVLVFFGAKTAFSPRIPSAYAATTTATIESMESSYQSRTGGRSVRIRYSANGSSYAESQPQLDDAWKVGDQLEVRYDTRNPRIKEWAHESPVRRLIGGAVIACIGVLLLWFVVWILRTALPSLS